MSEENKQYGWVAISRSMQEHWLFNDKPFCMSYAWIDLIMLCNYTDNMITERNSKEPIIIKRGQTMTSVRSLADRWGWNRSKVSRFLDKLSADNMICLESTNKYTIITVLNYDQYQGKQAYSDRDTERDRNRDTERDTVFPVNTRENDGLVRHEPRHGTRHKPSTNNNINNINNIKREIAPPAQVPSLEDLLQYGTTKGYPEKIVKDYYRTRAAYYWCMNGEPITDIEHDLDLWIDHKSRKAEEQEAKQQAQKKQNRFNDFHQRDYDFDDLETQLLNG